MISCTPQGSTEAQPAPKSSQSPAAAAPTTPPTAPTSPTATTPSTVSIPSGRYCYGIDTKAIDGVVRLSVQDGKVVGDSSVTIPSNADGYASSYAQKLQGTLQNGQIAMAVTTWIEYDRQTSQEVWIMTPETLKTQGEEFKSISCDVARERFVDADGLEAADLLDGVNLHTQRVQFAPGKSSTLLENSVVRGDRDVYLISAKGGQQMLLDIKSLEDNAVFDVISPSGLILLREAEHETLELPQTGDYQIVVGGTRGNASYTLHVEIP